MRKTRKKRKIFLPILISLIVLGIGGYFIYKQYEDVRKIRYMFKEIAGYAQIKEYTIYGNHLNIKGTVELNNNIDNVTLVLKNPEIEKEFPLYYEKDNNDLNFYLSSNINEGIDLEKIILGEYYIFIKIKINNEDKYYSLKNKTEYSDLEYYTITRDKHNKKIKLRIDEFKLIDKKVDYFKLTCKKTNLEPDIYDIVIDPGHGGRDSGALSLNGKYTEADISLDLAQKLKKELENIGLKVKLTRDSDDTLSSYGNNGRAVIANKVKAKLLLSLHLNSNDYKIVKGGVEIYIPDEFNPVFARLMANNIVNSANTTYSVNQTDRIEKGIYVRTFTKDDIKDAINQANKIGYEPYNITISTPALYMLRETGGIMTHAYIDGRNPNYDKNPYYDSNIAVEAYLLELGFINNSTDLNNILNNSDLYVKAISKAIKEHYNL